jgi:Glycosyl hydrolase family 81 C-terminal domain
MLALPHHAELLPPYVQLNLRAFDTTYSCIKGQLTPILGSTWSYDEPLLTLGFDGDKGSCSSSSSSNSNGGVSSSSNSNGQQHRALSEKSSSSSKKGQWRDHPSVIRIILDNLRTDLKLALPTSDENIYGFGKQVARLAQLAHIADILRPPTTTLDDNSTVTSKTSMDPALVKELCEVSQEVQGQLRSALYSLLSSNVSDSLVYDANLGGIVTMNGLLDSNADFGNGRYNDHHFHYGYIVSIYVAPLIRRRENSAMHETSCVLAMLFVRSRSLFYFLTRVLHVADSCTLVQSWEGWTRPSLTNLAKRWIPSFLMWHTMPT